MIVLFAVWAAVAAEPHPLDAEAFRFCHEGGVDAEEAKLWCEVLEDAPEDRCPGLRATCAGEDPESTGLSCAPSSMRGGGSGRLRGRLPQPLDPSRGCEQPRSCDRSGCEQSDGCEPAAPGCQGDARTAMSWMLALFVALVVAVVIRLAVVWMGTDRRPKLAPASEAYVLPEDEAVPDAPAPDLLDGARRALEEGDPGRAVLLARAASLRALGAAGRVRLHVATTDREYVRAVRKDKPVKESLDAVVRPVERWRFGGRVPDRGVAEAVLAAAARLLASVGAAWLLWVGDAAASSRYGPLGDAALHALLEASGRVTVGGSLDDLDDVDVIVLDLELLQPSDDEWSKIEAFVDSGGGLLVAGPIEGRFGFTEWEPLDVGTVWADDAGLYLPDGPQRGFVGAPGELWVEADGTGVVVVVFGSDEPSVGEGAVAAVSDGRLLENGALVSTTNETLLLSLLSVLSSPGDQVLVLDEAMGGDAPPENPWTWHMLPFVVQLLTVLGVAAWSRGIPLVAPRPVDDAAHADLSEHVEALATRWRQARASRRAASAVARLVLDRMGRVALLAAARREGSSEAEAAALLARATEWADQPDGPDVPEEDLRLMEALWVLSKRS